MTLGTGIGGGLILNNELYRGPGFAAGEIGHMPLNENGPACVCGGYGCFEQYVGRRYLQKKTKEIFKKEIVWQEVSALANKGNAKAIAIWKETAHHIGNGLTGLVNLLNPSRVVIGGGVSNCPDFVYQIINDVIKKRAMELPATTVKVVKAKLGSDAPFFGAKVLVEQLRGSRS
jgi:predicted NBD/HSP70 family sugar kinase